MFHKLSFIVRQHYECHLFQRALFAYDSLWAALVEAHTRLNPTDRKSTRLNSSHGYISYAVFCLKKKNAFSTELRLGRGLTRAFTHDFCSSSSPTDFIRPLPHPDALTAPATAAPPRSPAGYLCAT